MNIRKNIRALTTTERDNFINCLLELKRRGITTNTFIGIMV